MFSLYTKNIAKTTTHTIAILINILVQKLNGSNKKANIEIPKNINAILNNLKTLNFMGSIFTEIK